MSVYNFANSVVAGSAAAAGAAGQSTGFYPKTINQSLRFNDDDSAYLSRTPASAGNRKTWTWSAWVKRGNISFDYNELFGNAGSNSVASTIFFGSTDQLSFQALSNFNTYALQTQQVFRDTNAWYHIVVVANTTSGTASDRLQIYINGERITQFAVANYPPQDFDTFINQSGVAHYLGRMFTNTEFDGYMSEVHFTDGTAYTADDFGEFKSGVWVAKTPSVTYGTNGFYLDFADGAAIGDDESGNGNDWTPNNFTASDVVLDSPTDNFATFNATTPSLSSLSNGNLQYGYSTVCAPATIGIATGKWYFEGLVASQNSAESSIGVINDLSATGTVGSTANGWGILVQSNVNNGQGYHAGSVTSTYATFTAGDIIMVAFDADAGKIWFGRNGTWFNSGDPAAGTGEIYSNLSGTIFPAFANRVGSGAVQYANFGQDSTFAGNKTAGGNADSNSVGDFAYAPPTNFLSVSTANLPDPAIDPAQGSSPQDYFNTVLYTGDGTSSRAITGVGFEPDFVWIKERTSTSFHVLHDVIRGPNNILYSNTTDAQQTGFTNGLLSFDTDGFTVGDSGAYNQSSQDFVGWNWKAGGTGVSNTDGTITSTVSANTTSGFSIVSYTGNGAAGATVGHGLDSAPDMIIVKERSQSGASWAVYHSKMSADPETDYLFLNSTQAIADQVLYWNDTAPTSAVFSLGGGTNNNDSGETFIAYCFHNVEGFSKFGSYTGNGSTDGPFVYTGFRPAFLIVKRSDNTSEWYISDSARNPYNAVDKRLQANASDAENTQLNFDYLSNGFKLRAVAFNNSGGTFIYMAFAENPFKYSNAR